MENILFISCFFGNDIQFVNQAPFKNNCYFFSNNKRYKCLIEKKKWNFIYIDFPISSDVLICSLQSKYIKFLIFLKKYDFFKKFGKIIYFDHKEAFNNIVFQELYPLILNNKNKSLIIRKSEFKNTNLNEEIERSKNQRKYNLNLKKTISFINKNKIKPVYKYSVYNTGLLIYLNVPKIIPLVFNLYKICIHDFQPQCQIYFTILCEKYKNDILSINYHYLKKLKRLNLIDKTLFKPSQNLKILF